MRLAIIMALAVAAAGAARAAGRPIQDNSFLLEEAYNQEPGVLQHISAYARTHDAGGWTYSFTQEWPVGGQAHQFSWTFLWLQPDGVPDAGDGPGDLALNYRCQLAGSGDTPVALSPRMSLLLPTGDERRGRGSSAWGLQANLPLSVVLASRFVSHINLGGTYLKDAEDPQGNRADLSIWNFGQSFIWLAQPRFNVMTELVYTTGERVTGPGGAKERVETFFINPGVRWAHDFRSGLQIVPGVAAPLGVGPSSGARALFLYLSFEHPVRGSGAPGRPPVTAGGGPR